MRLREILRYYFGERYDEEFAHRIIPIAGDIESETLAENMPKDVQTVIHTAASVKHYGAYNYFNRVNVEVTRHVVNCAKAVGARLIHISTLSVSGNSLADEFAVYRSEEEKFFARHRSILASNWIMSTSTVSLRRRGRSLTPCWRGWMPKLSVWAI